MAIRYSNLAQLTSYASRVEQYIMEKKQRRSGYARLRGPQLISMIDCDLAEEDTQEDQSKG